MQLKSLLSTKTNCWWKPNPYRICIAQDFPFILKAEPPLEIDEEYVLYDVGSLFTNILVSETSNYTPAGIYDHHNNV